MLLDLFNREDRLEEKVLEVQKGNDELRNQLLQDYGPFIKKTISKNCKKFVTDSDEEYSIGLIAFNESIDNYSISNDAKFLTFASLVIKRRLIDYIRKNNKHEVSLSSTGNDFENEEGALEHSAIVKHSLDSHSEEKESEIRRDEIISLENTLASYKITFDKLVEVSPKHKDTRLKCMEIARIIENSPTIKDQLQIKKQLPINDLLPLIDVKKKTLERNRIYIIALTIVLSGDYPYMKDFLN